MKSLIWSALLLCSALNAATWDQSIVYYTIEKHTPKVGKEMIRKAADTWNLANVVTLVETERGNEDLTNIMVYWDSKRGSFPVDLLAFGFANWSFKDNYQHIAAAEIHINAESYRWPSPMYSLFALCCHEFGHVLGLFEHSLNDGDLMYYAQIQGPRQNDLDALARLYGVLITPRKKDSTEIIPGQYWDLP